MKRKLRIWVKITIGIASLTAISAAASCSNTGLTAVPARPGTTVQTVPSDRKVPIRKTVQTEKHVRQGQTVSQDDTLYVPQLVKEVVNI